MASDDTTLRIVLEDDTAASPQSQAGGGGSRPPIPPVPPVGGGPASLPPGEPEDEGGGSRFYRRYPWMKPGAGGGKDSSGKMGGGEPLPDEPWPGANADPSGKKRDEEARDKASKAHRAYEFFAGDPDRVDPASGEESKNPSWKPDEAFEFQQWMNEEAIKQREEAIWEAQMDKSEVDPNSPYIRRKPGKKVKPPPLPPAPPPTMGQRFMAGFINSVGPAVGAATGAATGSPTLGGMAGAVAGGGAQAMLTAAGPAGMALAGVATAAVIVVEGFHKLNEETSALARSIESVSGPVALAMAQREITQLQSAIQRNREIGPALARNLELQTEAQRRWEEIRTQIFKILEPLERFLLLSLIALEWVINKYIKVMDAAGGPIPALKLMQILEDLLDNTKKADSTGIGDLGGLIDMLMTPNFGGSVNTEGGMQAWQRDRAPNIPSSTFGR